MRMRILCFLFLACLRCLMLDCVAQTQGVLLESLKLRKTPSLKGVQIGTLKAGARVNIVDPNPTNGFYHVRISRNREGWLWAKSVKLSSARSGAAAHRAHSGVAQPGRRGLVRRPQTSERDQHPSATTAGGAACVAELASCPAYGCASGPGTPEGLLNQLKRTVPTGTNAAMLSFADFFRLQQQADNLVGEDKELSAAERAKLEGLNASNGQISEGELVSLLGYLVATPHPNTGESVNCNLKGEPNNDYHIPFSNDPNNTDFDGIVVEMIPQNRPAAWNVGNLTQVETKRQLVFVSGGLFYDNLHKVNADPSNPLSGQPHRFSLWEIHPVTQFLVCMKTDNSCDPTLAGDWAPL